MHSLFNSVEVLVLLELLEHFVHLLADAFLCVLLRTQPVCHDFLLFSDLVAHVRDFIQLLVHLLLEFLQKCAWAGALGILTGLGILLLGVASFSCILP